MNRIVFIQGPPRCGKDTLGEITQRLTAKADNYDLYKTTLMKFADPINEWMRSNFGVDCNDGHDKDAPCKELAGRSRREVAIAYSEEFMKPTFGDKVFGNIALEKLRYAYPFWGLVMFTDSGFKAEALPVIESYGTKACVILQVSRPGRDFKKDSRGYWEYPGVPVLEVDNTFDTTEGLRNYFEREIFDSYLSKPEWAQLPPGHQA